MPLPFYGKRADADFWDLHWKDVDIEAIINNVEGSFLARVIEKYLPRTGKILEGGCGLGQWVLYLKRKGYDIRGIDFAEDTIKRIKERFPDLPVETGNILNLPYPDGYFSGYISLGVIEHFEEGPWRSLAEAHRVLQKGGILLCSVPYYNPLRMLKRKLLRRYHEQREGEEFYCWAFTKTEITDIMETAGFKVRHVIPFHAAKGIKDEVPGVGKLYQRLGGSFEETTVKGRAKGNGERDSQSVSWRAKLALKWILERYAVRILFGHMLLVVAEK